MIEKLPTEHQEQVGFIKWFRAQYPSLFIAAIPNGEKRAISVAKRLKLEGVIAGTPDIVIALPEGQVLWVEMKRAKKGRVSENQKEVHQVLETLGHFVIIGYGATDASEKVYNFLHKVLALK